MRSRAETDSDNTVNGQPGTTPRPYPGLTKRGMIGVNFGSRIAEVTDGLSNTGMVAEMRVGLNSIDGRGTWAIGMGSVHPLFQGPALQPDAEQPQLGRPELQRRP